MNRIGKIFMLIKYHCLFLAIVLYLMCYMGILDKDIVWETLRKRKYNIFKKKYKKVLEQFDDANSFSSNEFEKTIWMCWFQGEEQAPVIVKKCISSVKKHAKDWNIVILDSNNYHKYANIPSIFVEKWKNGIISNTHFSDILRFEILAEHGGLWMDATCLLTDDIPEYITRYSFFTFKSEQRHTDSVKLSSWFMFSYKNNNVLKCTLKLEELYWKHSNKLDDYYLIHILFNVALNTNIGLWNDMPDLYDIDPHTLFFSLNNKFNEEKFKIALTKSFVHKLTYKIAVYQSDSVFAYLTESYNEVQ